MCLLIFYHCLLFPVILYCYISRTFNLHLFMQMAAKYSRSPWSQISHIWQEWIYKANNWIVKVNDSLRWMIALCNCYTNAVLELICFSNIYLCQLQTWKFESILLVMVESIPEVYQHHKNKNDCSSSITGDMRKWNKNTGTKCWMKETKQIRNNEMSFSGEWSSVTKRKSR